MDSSSCDNNYQSIAKQCLDLTKACVNNDQVVKLSLSIGTSFSFNFCSEHNAKPLPAVLPKKNKSPGTRARDLKRRAAFLHKKAAASTLPVALDFPPPESHEVEPSQTQPNLPLLHLNADPWTRNQMMRTTPTLASSPTTTTTTAPSACVSQPSANVSPPNPSFQ